MKTTRRNSAEPGGNSAGLGAAKSDNLAGSHISIGMCIRRVSSIIARWIEPGEAARFTGNVQHEAVR